MAASGRRCHYEVLGLLQDCTVEEIRSAYKKMALQLHPDKLVQSGLSQAEATAKFQELAQAYEVLSDPRERAWYDSHRSQILFADPNSADTVPDSVIPNLFSFFSNTVYSGYSDKGKGFYKVYSDVFNKIYANEINFATKLRLGSDSVREAPAMGNLDCPYAQVTAFYGHWLGFSTVMDFCWVDMYDAMAGPNRKSRRVMEEENKKLRKKAKREYNDTVRGLAEFVKKRDKRVIDMMVKRNLEMEKKREEDRERKKRLEKERLERAMAYEEPEWTRVVEEDEEEVDEKAFEEVDEKRKKNEETELYCALCGKKFKSEKQWKNHEQSKKHREKVAEFRDSIEDEDSLEVEDEEKNEVDDGVDELGEQMRDWFQIGEEDTEVSNGDDEYYDVDNANRFGKFEEKAGINDEDDEEKDDEDNEIGVLEAMLTGRKNRKNGFSRRESNETTLTHVHTENDSDEFEFMDYNKTKSTRRKRGARKERSKKNGEEIGNGERNESNNDECQESNGGDNIQAEEESSSSSHSVVENGINGKRDDSLAENKKSSSQLVDRKGIDTKTKSKNSSKGKKAKVIYYPLYFVFDIRKNFMYLHNCSLLTNL